MILIFQFFQAFSGYQKQRGAILNMASILAFSPSPELFPTHAYAASKGTIVTLTQTMAAYYVRHGIRVNAVAPSLTTSRMSVRAAADAATQAFAVQRQPLAGGFLPASDVADAALFLLSLTSSTLACSKVMGRIVHPGRGARGF